MVTAHDAIDKSLVHFHSGKLDRAEDTLRAFLRGHQRHAYGWLLLGLIRHRQGHPEEALEYYQRAAQCDPRYIHAYNNMGWAYNDLKQPSLAVASLRKALDRNPRFPEAHNNLGIAYLLLGKPDEALVSFRRAVLLDPDFSNALNNAALVLIPRRQLDEAVELLERALRAEPNYVAALVNLAWAYRERGDHEGSLNAAQRALQIDSANAQAHNNAGHALLDLGRPTEAAEHFQQALRLRPEYPAARANLGLAQMALGQLEEAIDSLRQSLHLDSHNAHTFNNLAFALCRCGRWSEAAEAASRAVQLRADFPEAYNNLGLSRLNEKRLREALVALREAVRLRPNFPEALSNLGWALIEEGNLDEAVAVLQEALRLRATHADALNNLGLALHQQNKPDEARDAYERALRVRADFPEARSGLANVLKDLGLLDDALPLYRQSLACNPHQPETRSNMLFAMHYSANVTPEEQHRELREWDRYHAAPLSAHQRPHPNAPDPMRRLRLGYVSADLRDHVMGWYLQPVLEAHDRDRFEIFCYSNVRKPDATTNEIGSRADHWREIFRVPDEAAEEMIRQDGIDLLIDLSGHTGGNRLTLFARKPAPVQASHFGYMDSTGLRTIDYRITDAVCDPPGMTERYHAEQLLRLPEIMWVYRPTVRAEVTPLPAASAGQLTLGAFNSFPKITAACVAAWSEILRRLPGSRLLLLAGVSPQADRRIRDAFAGHGIGPERLELIAKLARPDYFRLYQRVDLSLDTFPYSGCNTTCDSLWMGVPVVTLAGRTCMARQGASPLAHLGMNDLIAGNVEAYIEDAVRLAEDRSRLAELRSTLRGRMESSTLMNPRRFTRQLEDAFRWMWLRWCEQARAAKG